MHKDLILFTVQSNSNIELFLRCKPLPRCPSGYRCTKYQDPFNPCCKTMKIELPTLQPSCPANATSNFQPGCEPFSYFPVPTMPPGVTPQPITGKL